MYDTNNKFIGTLKELYDYVGLLPNQNLIYD